VDETARYTLMYVDDDPQTLRLFRRCFTDEYRLHTASNGPEALELLARESVHVLFADQRMPGMSGIQLLETVARDYPDTTRVLVTGYTDIEVVIDAINRGAVYRYLSKPWDIEDLTATVDNALELHSLKSRNQQLIASLDEQNRLLLRTVDELRFLNQLDLELKASLDVEGVLMTTIDRLGGELGAVDGWFWEAERGTWRVRVPPRRAGAAGDLQEWAEEVALEELEEPRVSRRPDGRSVCLLPLTFAEVRFGALGFEFREQDPLDPSQLLFIQAASHVASSALYSHHVRAEEIKKESLMMLGQMSSMIVHDLKGPLATILGFVSLLQADLPAEQRGQFGTIINQEVTRLIEMVEELLSFSKGQPHLQLSTVDLTPLVDEVLELFRLSFANEGVTVEMDCPPGLRAPCDRAKMKKVLINLVQNARDSLRDLSGGRKIRVRSSQTDSSLIIGVANTGPPMPEEVLPHIFDPFFSYKKAEGTGLGLTICKKIVEDHGGTLTVASESGYTEFVIRLPSESGAGPAGRSRTPGP
jgi:two-component system cell cycle sensor histidine kinase PleC